MANIQPEIAKISAATYGGEVRSSIVSALNKINTGTEEDIEEIRGVAQDALDEIEDFIQGELDTTLTSTVLAAQGKAVGDALSHKSELSNSTPKFLDSDCIDTIGTTWQNLTYNTTTGEFGYHANYLMSDWLPLSISNAGYATVHCSTGLYVGIYIFNESKEYVSNKTPATDGGILDINNVKNGYFCRILVRYNPASSISPDIMATRFITINPVGTSNIADIVKNNDEYAYIERYANRINKFPFDGLWYQGQVNSSNAMQTAAKYITTKIVPFPYNSFKVIFMDSTYKMYAKFLDKNLNVVAYTAGNDYKYTDETFIRTQNDIVYAVFNVGLRSNSNLTPSSGKDITIVIEDLSAVKMTKLSVCTYNVGEYQNGAGNETPVPNVNQVVPAYRKFFCQNNFDIIGLQEAHTNGFGDYGQTADEAMYNALYPYKIEATNLTTILSKFTFKESGLGWIQESDVSNSRRYAYAIIRINEKDLYIFNVHLNPLASERAEDITELIALLGTKNFICFGDFNSGNDNGSAQTEINRFISAGYHVANGGYLGLIATSGVSDGQTRKYLDNVVTSSNIIISNAETIGDIDDLYSDHLPMKVELTVY